MASATSDFRHRFLAILGIARREPRLAYLAHLTQTHLDQIPYENISKILRFETTGKRDLQTAEEYLDGIATSRFGGTCYATNYYFGRLLLELGFESTLVDYATKDFSVI